MRVEVYLTTHSTILDSISRRFVVVLNSQNSFLAGRFPRENWLHFLSFFSTALSFSFKFHPALSLLAFCEQTMMRSQKRLILTPFCFSQTESLTSLRNNVETETTARRR